MEKLVKYKWLRLFLVAKHKQFLQFLGLRLTDEWFLLRAIQREHGMEEAKALCAAAVILGLKYGTKNNTQTVNKIITATSVVSPRCNRRGL